MISSEKKLLIIVLSIIAFSIGFSLARSQAKEMDPPTLTETIRFAAADTIPPIDSIRRSTNHEMWAPYMRPPLDLAVAYILIDYLQEWEDSCRIDSVKTSNCPVCETPADTLGPVAIGSNDPWPGSLGSLGWVPAIQFFVCKREDCNKVFVDLIDGYRPKNPNDLQGFKQFISKRRSPK